MKFIIVFILTINFAMAQNLRVACYNVENLFDTINAPDVNDNDFTPKGKNHWSSEEYIAKTTKLKSTIQNIAPSIMGVCEVENEAVIADIIPDGFRYVHYDSPDSRGIDVALIYDPRAVQVVRSEPIAVSESYRTRHLLRVDALCNGVEITFLVAHLPSRRGASPTAKFYRGHITSIMDSLAQTVNNMVICGDFNQNPSQELLKQLYNTTLSPYKMGKGSYAYRDTWQMFDQILISYSLKLHLISDATIHNHPLLIQQQGRYSGYPLRGDPSDHLPVYIDLKL